MRYLHELFRSRASITLDPDFSTQSQNSACQARRSSKFALPTANLAAIHQTPLLTTDSVMPQARDSPANPTQP